MAIAWESKERVKSASENTSGDRSYDLEDVARPLYKLARELGVPIIALSQVSRGVEQQQDKRPMMSDLSQSGILEMVADNIIFAYRNEYYDPETYKQNILELILAKARQGDTGKIELLFDKSCGMIDSLKAYEFNWFGWSKWVERLPFLEEAQIIKGDILSWEAFIPHGVNQILNWLKLNST